MEPTADLIDSLARDKVHAARRMSLAQKLLAGPRLFDFACQFSLADIRRKHPSATAADLVNFLRARVQIAVDIENNPWNPSE